MITIGTHLAVQNYFTIPEPAWCCLKYNSGCHAYGLLTFRAVNLPEQRHLKQKLINACVRTFILASVNSAVFCLAS